MKKDVIMDVEAAIQLNSPVMAKYPAPTANERAKIVLYLIVQLGQHLQSLRLEPSCRHQYGHPPQGRKSPAWRAEGENRLIAAMQSCFMCTSEIISGAKLVARALGAYTEEKNA